MDDDSRIDLGTLQPCLAVSRVDDELQELLRNAVRCGPMPDEISWSHGARLAWLNGGKPKSDPMNTYKLMQLVWRTCDWLGVLADAAGIDFSTYADRHTISGLMNLDARKYLSLDDALNLAETSDFVRRPNLPKACPRCAREDIQRDGFTWYRRIHQVQGVVCCNIHLSLLGEVPLPTLESFVASLTSENITVPKSSAAAAQSEFVQAYQTHLFRLIAMARPIDRRKLQMRIRHVVMREIETRGLPRFGSILDWAVEDTPESWRNAFHNLDTLPNSFKPNVNRDASLYELALLFACHRSSRPHCANMSVS